MSTNSKSTNPSSQSSFHRLRPFMVNNNNRINHNKSHHNVDMDKSRKTIHTPSITLSSTTSPSATSAAIPTNNPFINPINQENDLWRKFNAEHITSPLYEKTKNKLNELISPPSKYSKDVLNSHGDVQTFIESEPAISALSPPYYLKYVNKQNPINCDVITISVFSEMEIFKGSGGNAKGKKLRITSISKGGKEMDRKEIYFYEYGHSDILKLKQPKQGNPYFHGIVSLSVNDAADVALPINEYIDVKFAMNAGKAAKWIDDKKLKVKGRGIFGGNGVVIFNIDNEIKTRPVLILRSNEKNGQLFGTETARNSKIEMRLYHNQRDFDGVDTMIFEMVKEKKGRKDQVTWKKEFCIATCIASVSDNNGSRLFGINIKGTNNNGWNDNNVNHDNDDVCISIKDTTNNGYISNTNATFDANAYIPNNGHFMPHPPMIFTPTDNNNNNNNNKMPQCLNIEKMNNCHFNAFNLNQQTFGGVYNAASIENATNNNNNIPSLPGYEIRVSADNNYGSSMSTFNTMPLFDTDSMDKASPNIMNNTNNGNINMYRVPNMNEDNNYSCFPPLIPQQILTPNNNYDNVNNMNYDNNINMNWQYLSIPSKFGIHQTEFTRPTVLEIKDEKCIAATNG